jgi:hypothetical protein
MWINKLSKKNIVNSVCFLCWSSSAIFISFIAFVLAGVHYVINSKYGDFPWIFGVEMEAPNGLRYLRSGGDGEAVQPEK